MWWGVPHRARFYNHLILSGTKITLQEENQSSWFYNHLILSGTKIQKDIFVMVNLFYNHLILSGTKIEIGSDIVSFCFTIT